MTNVPNRSKALDIDTFHARNRYSTTCVFCMTKTIIRAMRIEKIIVLAIYASFLVPGILFSALRPGITPRCRKIPQCKPFQSAGDEKKMT
jgi:hypothetical protein